MWEGKYSLQKIKSKESMAKDDYLRRAAEARASAFCKDYGEAVEVAGDLALAYAALARRKAKAAAAPADAPAEETVALTAQQPA